MEDIDLTMLEPAQWYSNSGDLRAAGLYRSKNCSIKQRECIKKEEIITPMISVNTPYLIQQFQYPITAAPRGAQLAYAGSVPLLHGIDRIARGLSSPFLRHVFAPDKINRKLLLPCQVDD